jgi:hypothetical protein
MYYRLVGMMAAAIVVAGATVQSATAQDAAPARVLPMVKPLHLVLTPPAATVPAACRRYAGAFSGQFAQGPYANLIISSVTSGPEGCVFHGTYAWSAYPANPEPGTTAIGPTEFLNGAMSGADLRLGNTSNVGLIVHPDLHADFYMQGSLVSRTVLTRLTPAALQ